MNKFIQRIYETRKVVSRSGEERELQFEVSPEEGEFLFSIIRDDPSINKTLEIGCAYGLSSLYICFSLKERCNVSHTIIDPYQYQHYDGIGIKHLKEAGIDFFNLIEDKSEIALPCLLKKMEGTFDFVFIDGFHTFDHTLLDCFYANRLLRVGGYLAIDDVSWPSIKRAVNFLQNYPCYEIHGAVTIRKLRSWKKTALRALMFPISHEAWAKMLSNRLYWRIFSEKEYSLIALKKISKDERSFNWHNDAF
jgi:predicted O-methyltransferase YrrM